MLVIQSDNALSRIIVTLNEKKTLTSAYFLFVFTNVVTKRKVTWIVQDTADLSGYPERFNEFAINPTTVFANESAGQWWYEVYEQESSSNTDPTGLTLVERGKMLLDDGGNHEFTGYEPANHQYKGYAG